MREFVIGMAIAVAYLVALIVAGTCLHGCAVDSEPGEQGETCAMDEDCASQTCLLSLGDGVWPVDEDGLGVCTEACDAGTCPEGSTCLVWPLTGESYCYDDCSSDEDCEIWSCETITRDLRSCVPDP